MKADYKNTKVGDKIKFVKAIDKASDAMMDWIVDHPIPGILGIIMTIVVVMVGSVVLVNYSNGVAGFGPEYVNQVTVNRLYVDGGRSSHYMVGTDKGVYEISNHLIPIQLFNCDELYSKLEVGKTYLVKIKGNKVTNWFMQQYPYIIEIR